MNQTDSHNDKNKQAATQSQASRDSGQRTPGTTKPGVPYSGKAGRVRTK